MLWILLRRLWANGSVARPGLRLSHTNTFRGRRIRINISLVWGRRLNCIVSTGVRPYLLLTIHSRVACMPELYCSVDADIVLSKKYPSVLSSMMLLKYSHTFMFWAKRTTFSYPVNSSTPAVSILQNSSHLSLSSSVISPSVVLIVQKVAVSID